MGELFMETRKSYEIYTITGDDSTGMIPMGVAAVAINYEEDGSKDIFYSPRHSKKTEGTRECNEEVSRINALRPTTQEGIERVIALIKEAETRQS